MSLIHHRFGSARLRCAISICALSLGLAIVGCGDGDGNSRQSDPSDLADIVAVAQANPDLSILVEAVVAANLQGLLAGEGPFTVFAPTDTALAALLDELGITKEQLLADVPLLTNVLAYHVLDARVPASDVPLGVPITPLQGSYFKIDEAAGGLVITDGRNRTSTILSTDVEASNGVIHVIDRVILPAP